MKRGAEMAKIILVASGKGGAGKSTVSALLGEAFASKKHPALLVELDSGLRSLDVALGVSENILFDMGDIIRGSCEIRDAVLPCPFCEGLSLIPAAAKPVTVTSGILRKIIAELSADFEYIILDCPAGIGGALENAAECTDLALVVATRILPPSAEQDPQALCFLPQESANAGLLLSGARRRQKIFRP